MNASAICILVCAALAAGTVDGFAGSGAVAPGTHAAPATQPTHDGAVAVQPASDPPPHTAAPVGFGWG